MKARRSPPLPSPLLTPPTMPSALGRRPHSAYDLDEARLPAPARAVSKSGREWGEIVGGDDDEGALGLPTPPESDEDAGYGGGRKPPVMSREDSYVAVETPAEGEESAQKMKRRWRFWKKEGVV
jgi:hypothetical protein